MPDQRHDLNKCTLQDQPEHGDDRYRWLNDRIGAVVGEVRTRDGGGFSVAIEVREILWEPLGTNA